jgi:GWxTD domain-containing protein
MKRSLIIAFLLLVPASSLFAQRSNRVNFVNLINRASAPQIFFDDIVLPTETGEANVSIIFRFDNDFLPFKKKTVDDEIELPSGMNYFTIASLNAEIFEGKAKRRRSNDVNIASRDRWTDTLYTKTFEETESKNLYASGSLTNKISPGQYNFVLQLSLMESTNERTSSRQNITIQNWDEKETGEIIFIRDKNKDSYRLMNLGDNVFFGKDFTALVRIPDYKSSDSYSVEISKASVNRRDTTKLKTDYSEEIASSDIMTNVLPKLSKGKDPSITFTEMNDGYTYAAVTIPNARFENAAYIIEVVKDGVSEPIAHSFFRSYWPDMPASLLNLDIAIDNMKFIVSEAKVKEIKSGSMMEKERKFREFWEQRDPSPNTVYNELMAEYYRRIDYAFKEFGNRGNLAGHESDQGEVYIKFGPPTSTDRQFPTNGKVIEIWEYPNRKFVFEATTGFGDFVLLGKEAD